MRTASPAICATVIVMTGAPILALPPGGHHAAAIGNAPAASSDGTQRGRLAPLACRILKRASL